MTFIIPHTFEAGQKAIAQEVNENFNYLKQSLDNVNSILEGKITNAKELLEADIDELQTKGEATQNLIETRDIIVRLGTINAPEALGDGQIPTAEFSLLADRIHSCAIAANANLILPEIDGNTKYVNCMLEFTLAEGKTLNLPENVKYSYGLEPDIIKDGIVKNRFMLDTTNGGETWMCYFSKDGE